MFRKITNGFRTAWGVKLYGDIRSVIETACRRSIGALEAIRLTLAGTPSPIQHNRWNVSNYGESMGLTSSIRMMERSTFPELREG